uniref:Uncharacterized protein n=1 Tax=Xiphophorus couchianus TaxID=32473 RepID=A0A3B5L230_9TELE
IRPISNTTEIFDTGLEAASLSFLASNLGLKSNTGSLNENIWKRTASHILVAFGVSVLISSLCRDHPLAFDFIPFDFLPFLSGLSAEHGSVLFLLFSVDLVEGASIGGVGSADSDFEHSCLICVTGVFGSIMRDLSAFTSDFAFSSSVCTFPLLKSFFTTFRESWSPLSRRESFVFVFVVTLVFSFWFSEGTATAFGIF